ncbi:MAG: LPS export ABC transporter periplasmic protein LptC [Alistipes indistinctus]
MKRRDPIRLSVALLFLAGAILLFGCKGKKSAKEEDVQNMMTQQSENLRLVYSQNGNLSYRFETPLLERYELAREPYMEFRKGVKVETYNDTTHLVESTLTANYAIFLENQQLWEAKGNVVATNAQGQKLETEQLFWNQKSKRIYSNVDSKVTQKDGVILGEGFESDEQFQDFIFRRPKGKVAVDTAPKERADSTGSGQAAAGSSLPVIREGRRWPSRNPDQRCTGL